MKLLINDQTVEVSVPEDTPLLWVLREEVGLLGTKFVVRRRIAVRGLPLLQCGIRPSRSPKPADGDRLVRSWRSERSDAGRSIYQRRTGHLATAAVRLRHDPHGRRHEPLRRRSPVCSSCVLNGFNPTTYDVPGIFGYLSSAYRM
jgi:hypothetical protein